MRIRLECYAHELDCAVAALGRDFNVKSVSKGYSDTRLTGTDVTPCTYRYYVDLDGRHPIKQGTGLSDVLTVDALRFLAELPPSAAEYGMPALRQLYGASGSFTDGQVLELFSEFRLSVLRRLFSGRARQS